jgi:hypothetical protein
LKLFIIIRGAQERTQEHCVAISEKLVGAENVLLLNEPSFSQAHIKSMEIGAKLEGFDYVIFLDADVLLIEKNFVENIKKGMQEIKDKQFYMLNYLLFDRQCKAPVYGMHLYNIETLKKALNYKEVAINAQRPETAVCVQMAKKGYKTYITPTIVGYHGYEQFYADMYRTAFVRGIKYKGHWDFYLPTFYNNKDKHQDYFWSYQGLVDGIVAYSEGDGIASLSKNAYKLTFEQHLKQYNLSEKEDLLKTYQLPILNDELEKINPLYEKNKGWLSPTKVGFNETSKAKKIVRRIYKSLKTRLKS